MQLFSDDDQRRISSEITKAEAMTSGEIIAVIAPASENYFYVPFMWAALVALVVPWPFIHFTWIAVQWIFLLQLLVFATLVFALWPRQRRTALVPRSVRNRHVERRAREQFLVQNLHTTAGRTGVLIFISIAERHAVVLADKGIDSKVPDGTWQTIVDRLTKDIGDGRAAEGFIHAIEAAGEHLAAHYPPGAIDKNELPDHLIVLEA